MDTEDQKPADADADAEKSAEAPDGADAGDEKSADGEWVEDISDTVAPSVGPRSTITHHAPVEHEQADVDAMGLEKRRQVMGGTYGPTFAKQATLYGGVLAIIAALIIGFVLLAGKLDQPPETSVDEAPWSSADAEQTPPAPLQ